MSAKNSIKKIIGHFNFNTSISLNNRNYKIPIINNMGYANRHLKGDGWLLQLFKTFNLAPDATFIDVGVNVGQTLLAFRSCFENNMYIGFEPNSSCVYYVNKLVQVNRLKNVNIIPAGLSVDNLIAKFYTKGDVDAAATTVNELRPGFYNTDNVTYVPIYAFDTLQLDNAKKISLIKIDVEGGELEVISGMKENLAKHKPVVVCEILDSHTQENIPAMQARADKLAHIMESLQYEMYRIFYIDGKITPKPMAKATIKMWTTESWNSNDYLFLPKGTQYKDYLK
jgi:FkbM family methyltransferase